MTPDLSPFLGDTTFITESMYSSFAIALLTSGENETWFSSMYF